MFQSTCKIYILLMTEGVFKLLGTKTVSEYGIWYLDPSFLDTSHKESLKLEPSSQKPQEIRVWALFHHGVVKSSEVLCRDALKALSIDKGFGFIRLFLGLLFGV